MTADQERGSLAPNSSFIIRANSRRVARILAISSKKSMLQLTRMAMRGAKLSMSTPAAQQFPDEVPDLDEPQGHLVDRVQPGLAEEVGVFQKGMEAGHLLRNRTRCSSTASRSRRRKGMWTA